jgi:hypothetical protein
LEDNSVNKEELLAQVDGVLKIIKFVFILILLFPFVFYFSSKIDLQKEEVTAVVEAPLIKDGIDLESGLIVDENYEIVRGTCSACHSLALVTQNSATREGWKDLIVWMQQTQKLWDLGENEVLILDYLEKNYAPKEHGRRAPLKDVDWYEI